jgi:hypothetical protein
MLNKFLSLLVGVIIVGTASIASARSVSKYRPGDASGTAAAESFQAKWNVSY